MRQPFFEYFSSTRIISLKRRTDRRREMIGELKRVGQKIDGRKVLWFDAIAPAEADGFPSIGARGCFLSHLELLRAARRDGIERLLILEDDAHFVRQFTALQDSLLSDLKTINWDIFYAGYTPMTEIPKKGPILGITADIPLQTSHAMAMNQKAIHAAIPYLEAILRRQPGSSEGGPMHIDGAYSWFRAASKELNTVIANPQIITQRASASDITPSSSLKNTLADALGLRRLKNFFK